MNTVTVTETNGGAVLEVQLTGKLSKVDYEHLIPAGGTFDRAGRQLRQLDRRELLFQVIHDQQTPRHSATKP